MDNGTLKEITRYSGEKKIARFDSVLHNFGGSFIPAGQYSFPFSFKTGESFPASFIVLFFLSGQIFRGRQKRKNKVLNAGLCARFQ